MTVENQRLQDEMKKLEKIIDSLTDEVESIVSGDFKETTQNAIKEDLTPLLAEQLGKVAEAHISTLNSLSNHHKEQLEKHQTFWTSVAATVLLALLGLFATIEDSHLQNTMTLHATHIQEIFSQEKEKIDVVLNGFKEKLHTHHK
jgi:hypothetical protein